MKGGHAPSQWGRPAGLAPPRAMPVELSVRLPGPTSVARDVPTCLRDPHLLLERIQSRGPWNRSPRLEKDGFQSARRGGRFSDATPGHLGNSEPGSQTSALLWSSVYAEGEGEGRAGVYMASEEFGP